MPPFLHLCPLQVEVPVEADGLQITPVLVNHLVPTFGYIVSDGSSAVILGAIRDRPNGCGRSHTRPQVFALSFSKHVSQTH
jgi:hypothetical protein